MRLTHYQEQELKSAQQYGRLSWRSTATLEKRGLVKRKGEPSVFQILSGLPRDVEVTKEGRAVLRDIAKRDKR